MHFFAAILLAFAVFLAGLGAKPVPTIDGAVYASVARNIVESGVWFPLSYEGRPFLEHPPLYVWSLASSFRLFGISDFAANFPGHFFAFLTVVLTYIIGRSSGLSRGLSLASTLVLCSTRDYVLSQVRGYIEPVLIFFCYLGFWAIIQRMRSGKERWTLLAALSVLGAALSKGPPALWPALFYPFCLVLYLKAPLWTRLRGILFYTVSGLILTATVFFAVRQGGFESLAWQYFQKQVLGSALNGRGGLQPYDPFFFVQQLRQYYWPWLPFFIYAALASFLKRFNFAYLGRYYFEPAFNLRPFAFTLFGLGFFAGFSIVKWKFWYYIAPAYPAFALAIASVSGKPLGLWFERRGFAQFVGGAALAWIAFLAVVPWKTYRDRVPEVKALAPVLAERPPSEQVFALRMQRDTNLFVTSGNWSFHRQVQLVPVEKWDNWSPPKGTKSWIVIGESAWNQRSSWCHQSWCRLGTEVVQRNGAVLISINQPD